jgi:predicted transcriptional regulator
MLECCRHGSLTSLIIHKCNLKYPLFRECMEFLKSKDLIDEMDEAGKIVFKNTEKGNEALKNYTRYYLQLFQDTFKPLTERHIRA